MGMLGPRGLQHMIAIIPVSDGRVGTKFYGLHQKGNSSGRTS